MDFLKRLWYILSEYYEILLKGLANTLIIALLGLVIGIVVGTIIATLKVMPKNTWISKVLDKLANLYITIFRGTPLVVQLLVVHYVILGKTRIEPIVLEAVVVFGLNSAAYVAEIMRAGIMAVDRGQMEAARSLGLGYTKSMFLIVLPQAVKNIVPTLGNEFISLLKETSVAGFITVTDLTRAVSNIVARDYDAVGAYILLALIYLVMVISFTYLLTKIERRLRASDKR